MSNKYTYVRITGQAAFTPRGETYNCVMEYHEDGTYNYIIDNEVFDDAGHVDLWWTKQNMEIIEPPVSLSDIPF